MSRRFRERWTAPEAGDRGMGGEDDSAARERRGRMAAVARLLEQEFEGHGFALLVFDESMQNRGERGDQAAFGSAWSSFAGRKPG